MKTKSRWMKWVLEESAKEQPPLPWSRNTRPVRARRIARPRAVRG